MPGHTPKYRTMFAKSKRPPIMESLSQVVSPCVFAMSDPSKHTKREDGCRVDYSARGHPMSPLVGTDGLIRIDSIVPTRDEPRRLINGTRTNFDRFHWPCLHAFSEVMGRLDKSPLPPPRNSSPHRTWWIPSHGMAVGCHPLSTHPPPRFAFPNLC